MAETIVIPRTKCQESHKIPVLASIKTGCFQIGLRNSSILVILTISREHISLQYVLHMHINQRLSFSLDVHVMKARSLQNVRLGKSSV